MLLHEIKIIDLKHSKWDEEKSNPKKGKYAFIDKKYIDYKDKGRRPPYFFTWCHYDERNNYLDLRSWKVKWGYEEVTSRDDYIPEGLGPNVEGHYVYGDLILVRRNLLDELLRLDNEQKMAKLAGKMKEREMRDGFKRAGVAVDDVDIEKMLKDFGPR